MAQKVMLVFGTRPSAIKMAPLVHQLKAQKDLQVVVCVSAQHREMLDSVLDVFQIKPDYDLDIMREGQDLFDITTDVLLKLKPVLQKENPDLVLVQGDTSTAISASLASAYLKIPVGHVEAGLRTYNSASPWPEELNRQIVARIAKYHFAPTQLAKNHLLSEHLNSFEIIVTGNTVIDALLWVAARLEKDLEFSDALIEKLSAELPFNFQKEKYVLITGHRRENFGEGFLNICEAVKQLAQKNQDVHWVYPVHLNPNVKQPVYDCLGELPNVHLIPPQDYAPFIVLLKNCYLVLTDSGGVQEEAPSLGKPVLVMRDTTERPEAIEAGTAHLVGTNQKDIIEQTQLLLDNSDTYSEMAKAVNPYGDGLAAERIEQYLDKKIVKPFDARNLTEKAVSYS